MSDGPMKLHVVIVALFAETDEIFTCFGCDVCVEFKVDDTQIRYQADVAFLLYARETDLISLLDRFGRLQGSFGFLCGF